MKKALAPFFAFAALSACGHAVRDDSQVVRLDDRDWLAIKVDGVQARASAQASPPRQGEPIHRILQSADGQVLFQYDVAVTKNAPGKAWNLLLKPAGSGPTFAVAREVTVTSGLDKVRVDLMEQPSTGQKIADVFTLLNTDQRNSELHSTSFAAHAIELHNRLYRFIHGK